MRSCTVTDGAVSRSDIGDDFGRRFRRVADGAANTGADHGANRAADNRTQPPRRQRRRRRSNLRECDGRGQCQYGRRREHADLHHCLLCSLHKNKRCPGEGIGWQRHKARSRSEFKSFILSPPEFPAKKVPSASRHAGFPTEHRALPADAPVIAGEITVLADDAMTRHDEADRVLANRGADRACGFR